jgi:hypothetical protein
MAASLQTKEIEPAVEKSETAPAVVVQSPATLAASDSKSALSSVVQPPAGSAMDSQAAAANPAQPGSPDPALVEAVVQRILDKMRPQVVDIITKEFLRPIVQALVHREIEKH